MTASIASGNMHRSTFRWLAVFDLLVLGVMVVRGTYRFRLSSSVLDELGPVVVATVSAVVVVLAARSIVPRDPDAALQTLQWGALATLNLAFVRIGAHVGRRRRFRAGDGFPTLIVGAGSVGRQVARRFLEQPGLGLRPVGFLDKEPRFNLQDELELPVLGASWDLERHALAYNIDHIVIAFSTAPHHVLVDVVRRSHILGLHVLLVPRLFEEVPLGTNTEFAGGIPLLRIEPAARGWRLSIKYLIDRVTAGFALTALSPMLLLVALAVRCTSRGPAIFRQRRIGLDGREFDMLKFRTMTGSAEVQGEADARWVGDIVNGEALPRSGGPAADRRTPLGRFLRKSSIDELPQLINVLRGEMSLVGPRPERATLVSVFNGNIYRYADRHRMKCGITGLAQVHNLRGETSLVDRIEWDNRYIQHWSLWLDLKILLLSLPAMLRGH